MSDTAELIARLQTLDVRVWLEGERLKCSAPKAGMTDDIRKTLTERKDDIVAYLRQSAAISDPGSTIVPIKRGGGKTPIFAVSGHGGDVFCLRSLSLRLDAERPLIGVQPPGLDGSAPLTTLEDLARYEIEQIRRYTPRGPYLIAGHCAGGALALEVAQQLKAAGEEVAMLALIGAPFPSSFNYLPQKVLRVRQIVKTLTAGDFSERRDRIVAKLRARLQPPEEAVGISRDVMEARNRVERATVAAVRNYSPKLYDGQMDVYISGDAWHKAEKWRPYARITNQHYIGEREINDMLLGGNCQELADKMNQRMAALTF